jgi:uncharacterized protein (DUF433 family)
MAALDWSQCPAVESIPGKRSGEWVFRDTRMPVSVVFDNLEAGASISEVMEWFHLSHEQVVAVIEFAARSLDAPPAHPPRPNGRCSYSLIMVLQPHSGMRSRATPPLS